MSDRDSDCDRDGSLSLSLARQKTRDFLDRVGTVHMCSLRPSQPPSMPPARSHVASSIAKLTQDGLFLIAEGAPAALRCFTALPTLIPLLPYAHFAPVQQRAQELENSKPASGSWLCHQSDQDQPTEHTHAISFVPLGRGLGLLRASGRRGPRICFTRMAV